MKIFIIGGTGVLSTDVVKECLRQKDELYVLNRGHNKQEFDGQSIHTIVADIRDVNDVRKKISNIHYDVVVDFLSYQPDQLESTFKLFGSKCRQYIFISSCCVFRRSEEDGIIKEESYKPNTILSYGYNKYQCELKLRELSSKCSCEFTIVRPYITYGDTRIPFGLTPRERYHWTIIGRILEGKPFFIWDEGENLCSLLHTTDFAKIFHKLLLNKKAFGEDVNLTGNKTCRWIDMLTILYEAIGKDANDIISVRKELIIEIVPEFQESLLGDRSLNAVFDTTKLFDIVPEAKKILNAPVSLEDGIRRTIESYKANNYYRGIDYSYDAKIDRLLAKNLRNGDKRLKKLHYTDYLHEGSIKNLLIYIKYRYFSKRFRANIKRLFCR